MNNVLRTTAIALLAATAIFAQAPQITAKKVTEKKDLVYGVTDGSALLADLAYPEAAQSLPIILLVHGGRWRTQARTDAQFSKQADWAAAGFFAMNIDYRQIASTPAPACYQDLYPAIRWVHAHAAEYHLNTNRFYLMGQSSGGHLVSLAATLGAGSFPKTGGWDNAPSTFTAAISIAGAYDLNALSWGILWTPLAGEPSTGYTTLSGAALDEARRFASPIRQIGAAAKPLLIVHSDDDRSVPIQEAVDMDKALTAAGTVHKFVHYTDRGHMSFTDEITREARAFIQELEKK
jgi:alpha-L-fucosidase 2